MFANTQWIAKKECAAQQFFSVTQLEMCHVAAAEVKNIEKVIEDWNVDLPSFLQQ